MVLVSHTHRFIFFKTKKTASTSVEMFFEPFCLPPGQEAGPEHRDEYIGETGIVGSRRGRENRRLATWRQHLSAFSVLKRTGPGVFFRYFKFVTIRNPYTRTLSAFRYTYHRNPGRLSSMTFDEHRAAFNAWLEENYVAVQDRQKYTIAGLPIANGFIRYEHLHEDIIQICERLGLPCDLDRLPHTKKMPKPERHYLEYYTAENRARIARTHAWEIRTFGYDSGSGRHPPATGGASHSGRPGRQPP